MQWDYLSTSQLGAAARYMVAKIPRPWHGPAEALIAENDRQLEDILAKDKLVKQGQLEVDKLKGELQDVAAELLASAVQGADGAVLIAAQRGGGDVADPRAAHVELLVRRDPGVGREPVDVAEARRGRQDQPVGAEQGAVPLRVEEVLHIIDVPREERTAGHLGRERDRGALRREDRAVGAVPERSVCGTCAGCCSQIDE